MMLAEYKKKNEENERRGRRETREGERYRGKWIRKTKHIRRKLIKIEIKR